MTHRHAQRITKGQVAGTCGLMIAGLSYVKACRIVGAPVRAMAEYLQKDPWRGKNQPPRRWKDEQLAELYEYWINPAHKTKTIAERFNVSESQIWKLAKSKGWPPRKRGVYSPVQKHQRPLYNKFRKVFGRERAIQEVCR